MALIILDRDGVINHDSDDYIRSLDEWLPIDGSIEAIAQLAKAGFKVAIATNQSGLSRGYFDLDTLEAIHARLVQLVEEQGGSIAGIFYCPHLPDEGCNCRKPAIGLVQAIESELGEAATGCWFIGDSLKDLQAAQTAGCHPALVLTGKGLKTQAQLNETDVNLANPGSIPIFANLADSVNAILSSPLATPLSNRKS